MSYLAIGRLILLGVSKSKIIAKYGKKAYDAAKNVLKNTDKKDLTGLALVGGAGVTLVAGIGVADKQSKKDKIKKDKIRSSKDKKFKGHTGYRK